MAQATRQVTAILRDIDTITKTPHLTANQKEVALGQLRKELALATQPELPLDTPPNGGITKAK